MHRPSIVVFLVALWLALATTPLHAQYAPWVYDHGEKDHARGYTVGNQYWVAPGDTLFSIGVRFNVAWQHLQAHNNVAHPERLQANEPITIPYLDPGAVNPGTVNPGAVNPGTVNPGTGAGCTTRFLTIDTAGNNGNVYLGYNFSVTGRGCGLGSSIVVSAQDVYGIMTYSPATWLSTANGGGEGTYTVQMNVTYARGQTLTLLATSDTAQSNPFPVNLIGATSTCTSSSLAITKPQAGPQASSPVEVTGIAGPNCTVMVTARNSGGAQLDAKTASTGAGTSWSTTLALPANNLADGTVTIEARIQDTGIAESVSVFIRSYANLNPPWCQISIDYTINAFTNPDGPPVGTVPGPNILSPRRVVNFGGQLWYAIPGSAAGSVYDQADAWVRRSDVRSVNGTCGL